MQINLRRLRMHKFCGGYHAHYMKHGGEMKYTRGVCLQYELEVMI